MSDASAAVSNLFQQAGGRAAARSARFVWVFVGLLVLLLLVGFYVFWYVMCDRHGGIPSLFRCDCGTGGKYKLSKFGCECGDGYRPTAMGCISLTPVVPKDPGEGCTPSHPPCCNSEKVPCCTSPDIVDAVCDNVTAQMKANTAAGVRRFSPAVLKLIKDSLAS